MQRVFCFGDKFELFPYAVVLFDTGYTYPTIYTDFAIKNNNSVTISIIFSK